MMILVGKALARENDQSIKTQGISLRQTQNCSPRPQTHLWSEVSRSYNTQILDQVYQRHTEGYSVAYGG